MKSKLKISFQLKPGEKSNIQVLAFINYGYKEFDLLKRKYNYKPLIFFTGINVERTEWDSASGLPMDREKRTRLEVIRDQIEKVYQYLVFKGEIDRKEFKEELDHKIKGKEESLKKVRIVDFIEDHILTSSDLGKSSKPPYKGLANKLTDYEKKIGKLIYSNDVDKELYLHFLDTMKDRLNKVNGLWSIQKVFKSVLNKISVKYKITVFNPTTSIEKKDKIRSEVPENVYINMDQIKSIIETEPKDEKMKNIKFILMILLFTGCRESDVYKIIPEKSYQKGKDSFKYAHYVSTKTETEVLVPILKPLQQLFDRNKGRPPYKIAQQTFNIEVKNFILSCRLKDEVTMSHTDTKGKKQFVTKKFYQWVTSHTGRRSFITNLINFIPLPILTKITGHKLADREIVFAYNKISLLENAVLFRKILKQVSAENKEYFPIQLI